MKKIEEIAQNLKAEFSREAKRLVVVFGYERVVDTIVPDNESDDFWHGATIDGAEVDFNFDNGEGEHGDTACLVVYPVVDGRTDTHIDYEIPVTITKL